MRQPLRNAFAQTDVSGTDGTTKRYLRDFAGIDVPRGNTVYVDASLTDNQGKIGSSLAFNDLATAIALAATGSTIIVRPGTYALDNYIIIKKNGLRLIGYGAVITPATAGESVGFTITSNFCTVEGFEFDGGIAAMDAVDVDGGAVGVQAATGATLRNLYIHDCNTHGIWLPDRFSSLKIDNCKIVNCNTGICSPGVITQTVNAVSIKNCPISSNRNEGIKLAGIDNAGGVLLKEVRIQDNELISNDAAGSGAASISLPNGSQSIFIEGNYCFDSDNGIEVAKVKRAHISDNIIESVRGTAIEITGWLMVNICDNTIEGANQNTGNPLSANGIVLQGDYASANDSSVANISSNLINQITSSGYTLKVDHGSNIKAIGNRMRGPAPVLFKATQDVRFESNTVNITTGNNVALTFDQDDRATTGVTSVLGNGLFTAGAPTKLVGTNNANSLTMDTFILNANASTPGKTYSGGIYAHISGTAPTVYKLGNSPVSTTVTSGAYDARNGWVNDTMTALPTKEVDIARGSASEKVIGARKPGWGLPTATLLRSVLANYTAATISNPPTQAEVQTIATEQQVVVRTLAALIYDLHADGTGSTHALLDDA